MWVHIERLKMCEKSHTTCIFVCTRIFMHVCIFEVSAHHYACLHFTVCFRAYMCMHVRPAHAQKSYTPHEHGIYGSRPTKCEEGLVPRVARRGDQCLGSNRASP
jgi:hypothetical protein